ncbi:MAG: ChrR family anti-sigma-E factor [Pseudomonadota bacterium]
MRDVGGGATHQLSEEILAGYAAGTLPEAFSAVVATQASICAETRERLRELEVIGGALFELGGSAEMRLGALEATMAKIAAVKAAPPVAPGPEAAPDPVLPKPLRAYVGGGIDAVKWRPIGMGAKQAILHETTDSSLRLLQIPAGCELPDHGHQGVEMTLVLQGAFLDGADRYARGDVDLADEETEHRPIADVSEDCVCLVACEGRLKFSGLLPKLAQPFLRI